MLLQVADEQFDVTGSQYFQVRLSLVLSEDSLSLKELLETYPAPERLIQEITQKVQPYAWQRPGVRISIKDNYLYLTQSRDVIIAVLNGTTCGAGAVIAAAADVRIAAESAKIAFLFTKVGLSGADMGAAWLLPRIVRVGASVTFHSSVPLMPAGGVAAAVAKPGLDGVLSDIDPSLSQGGPRRPTGYITYNL